MVPGLSGDAGNDIGCRCFLSYEVVERERADNSIQGKETDYFVGPNKKVLPKVFQDWIGDNQQKNLLERAENPLLQNAIKQLYRGNSFIGDGGTANVILFEKQVGLMLGKNGGSHIQKGLDMASYIKNKILKQNLSVQDEELANQLLRELEEVLKN